jgi:hypothetical protein
MYSSVQYLGQGSKTFSRYLFFLSETKTQTAYATVILNSLGYFLMSHSPPTGSKGGLLLAWHHGVDLEFF